MANLICACGNSGSGKSHSVSTLDPKETFLISVSGKKLPMRGFDKKYTPFSNTTPDGNKINTANPDTIQKALSYINKKRNDVKNVIIDDRFNYL